MRIFIDTANVDEIRAAAKLGVVDGVTTNPTLMAKEHKDYRATVREICGIVPGDVSAEVIGTTVEDMLSEGRNIATWHERVVVKLPITEAGIEACSILTKEGIRTNMTLCFSANQALLAALAGATYVSPFVGRLDDQGDDGMQVIADIVEVYQNYAFDTQVLAASIRHPIHVTTAAKLGADVATMPYKIFQQLVKHSLTDVGLDRFIKDWKAAESSAAARK